jgi:phosphate transport system substrate-binding protein
MKLSRSMKIASVAVATLALSAQAAFAGGITVTGGGSSFDAPLLNACKVAWQSSTGNTFNYTSSSSGTGQTNEDAGIGDINFSDSGYTPAKSSVLNIPVAMAPIAVGYNLPGTKDLYLSQKTLSDIFAGVVTKWNDPEITADNNGSATEVIYAKDASGNVKKDAAGNPIVLRTVVVQRHYTLPNQPIHIVARADSSGTTQNFLKLFTANPDKTISSVWTKPLGKVFTAVFPGNVNGAGNIGRIQTATGSAGVAALMNQTPYSIGYFEPSYATGNLRNALLGDANGDWAGPTAAATAAFVNAGTFNSQGLLQFDYSTKTPGAYVLGIVSYVLVDSALSTDSAKAAHSFIKYVLNPACPTAAGLGFSPITGAVLAHDQALIAKLS